jgi:hypothetical protein
MARHRRIFAEPSTTFFAQGRMMRRPFLLGAFLVFCLAAPVTAQVIERPVPFDSAAHVMVMTPLIADRAALRLPVWPVAGDFVEARLYTVTDSSYILTVRRGSGVVERYPLTAADREAIRVSVSRLPPEVVRERNDAGSAFIRNQTLLGVFVYGPAFAAAIGDNAASATAGYLVVAGGSFFAASEIARRNFISRPQNDLSFNTGRNGALGTWGVVYLAGGEEKAQAAGAFIGGLAGTGLGLRFGRGMTEAEAVGAGFGADLGALIGWGATEAFKREDRCTLDPASGFFVCRESITSRAQIFTIIASGLVGYPLGVLYPRNSSYNVTPGDIQTLWPAAAVGFMTGISFLPESPRRSRAFLAGTAGGILGVVAGDRFLVRRADHSRTDASRLTLGTIAGGLMGAGVAALIDNDLHPPLVFSLTAAGGLVGMIVTERSLNPRSDAGRQRVRLGFDPAGFVMLAAGKAGTHSLLTVRF